MTTKHIAINLGSLDAEKVAQLLDMVNGFAEADAPDAVDPNMEAVSALADASKHLYKCRDMLVKAASGAAVGADDADEAFARAAHEAESARWGVEDVMPGVECEAAREDLREACWRIGRVESAARDAGDAAGKVSGGLAARMAGDAVNDALVAVGLVTASVMAM